MVGGSTLSPGGADSREAFSHQDYGCAYVDTIVEDRGSYSYDWLDNRLHKPLGVRVEQRSMAWSYQYAEDMVFFDLKIKNISSHPVRKVFVGLLIDPDVQYQFDEGGSADDVCGFLQTFPSGGQCGFPDSVNVAWAADNDGDPYAGEWRDDPVMLGPDSSIWPSTRGVVGVKILSQSTGNYGFSFNWWSPESGLDPKNYGPMRRDHYRDFRTGYNGEPKGDRNLYYLLSNGDMDFDQAYTSVMPSHDTWIVPDPAYASDIADGSGLHFIMGVGPAQMNPGAELSLSYAVVCGDNFHLNPANGANLPDNPWAWYGQVDFTDLVGNAMWAQRIYDNPGVDTDGDGYAGEYRVCVLDSALVEGQWVPMVADTEWYQGDGVPDWRASTPPIAPYVWVEPIKNGLHVRINGEVSETAKDVLTETVDFEGYRVYLGRDERKESFSLVASYDKDNYDKWVFDSLTGEWSVREDPFTLGQLRCLYGTGSDPCTDSSFIPVAYFDRSHYFQMAGYPDSVFFFTPHDRNSSAFGINTPLTKTYPDMPDPRTLSPEQLTPEMYTEDGYLKFYEYQLDITDLLPTVGYFVSVTTFDFGSPASGVAPLETEITEQPVEAFPLHPLDQPLSGSDEIYIYPNPYRLDVDYRELGLEGRNQDDRWDERVRAIWFANLPPKCTIHIFTLDGDRVRTIEHDVPITDPTYRRHAWDLINRNYQTVKTGLYYWVVEIPGGKSQVGKLALIR